MAQSTHPKQQSEARPARDLVKPGSTMERGKGGASPPAPGQQGQQGQQQAVWPQSGSLSDDDREKMRQHQQEAWDLATERSKDNNPATQKARTYDKNAPGMHPANQPAPDTKLNKATRLDLEDITGNPGHRGVNADAPAGSINGPPDDRTGRTESINEPSHINQNYPDRSGGQVRPRQPTPEQQKAQQQGAYPDQQNAVGVGTGSINEPEGSQVIPQGAGQGAGGVAGGIGTEYQTPKIDSLHPDEVELGTPDLTVRILGSGFTPQSAVEVEGEVVSCAFISEGEMTTTVKPSQYAEAGQLPIVVKNGGYASKAAQFELTEPAQDARGKRR